MVFLRERAPLQEYIVPGYDQRELEYIVGHGPDAQAEFEAFAIAMPFAEEIDAFIDPYLTPSATPMILGRSTAEILFTMKRLQPAVYGHSQSVAELAVAIAEEVGTEEPLHEVRVAGDLHDIYKIGLRDLTDVKGPFTEDQRAKYRSHPTTGSAVLYAWGYPVSVVNGARYHHCGMRYPVEAANYPNVPLQDIPRIGKVINIADYCVTALTDRSYKRAVPIQDIEYQLYKAAEIGRVEPEMVDAFLRIYYGQGDAWMRHSPKEPFLGAPTY